ncbi:hypothetical protein GOV09_01640, partial [Candidatus Woesearchaeota archaeon]|nr:hypothetical protein [Candidatus Woesearchaeota archaeon]
AATKIVAEMDKVKAATSDALLVTTSTGTVTTYTAAEEEAMEEEVVEEEAEE